MMHTRMRRLPLFFLSLFTLMVLLIGQGESTPLAHAATTTPTLMLSKTTAHPNETIAVTAQGFAPDDTVSLGLVPVGSQAQGLTGTTLTCDAQGDCSGQFTIPLFIGTQGQYLLLGYGSQPDEPVADAPLTINPAISFHTPEGIVNSGGPGTPTQTATGENSGLQASTPLNVGPGIQTNTPINPGGTLQVQGGGFNADETLSVYVVGQKATTSIAVTTAADGSFQTELTIPLSLVPSASEYHVAASNTDSSEKASAFFNVAPPNITWTNPQQLTFAGYRATSTITGQDFPANEPITLDWNYQQVKQTAIGTVTAATDGSFSLTFTNPSSPFSGNTTIEAIAATATYTATLQVPVRASLFLSPSVAQAGQTVTVTGGSFSANAPITLTV